MTQEETIHLRLPPIEEVFDSVGKIRILNLLANVGELNITAITECTGLNHVRVSAHLAELQDNNIIQEKRFGRIKIFRLNSRSEAANRIQNFFSGWNNEGSQNNR